MIPHMFRSRGMHAVLALCVLLFGTFASFISTDHKDDGLLKVTFLNVGQGDATFIESPIGTQVLIDGGRDGRVLRELPKVMGYFDRTIDVVIATHPDADHIGGLIDVLKRYDVRSIVMTDNVNDTPVSRALKKVIDAEGATIVMAHRGQILDLGRGAAGSTTLAILYPDRDVRDIESNMSSIIAKLTYGTADVLLTGDAPQAIETYLLGLDRASLQSEVLKVGHHGSRTSSAPVFVEAVQPQIAIISAGKNNEYGHPHKEVMETLKQYQVITKNTADLGSIFLFSDGDQMWFK